MSELGALLGREEFAGRHLGADASCEREMLAALGVSSMEALIGQVVPAGIRLREPLAEANTDRKSTRLNSSHVSESRMPSSA